MDITAAAAPKADQINADDLIAGPQVVTITDVREGNAEQPVEIVTAEFGTGRPYRPGKSMIRVLISAWGAEASAYKGRKLKLYRDPEISFGRDKVGGIRISHMSHIDKRITLALTVTRGKRSPYVVEPLLGPPEITDEQANEIASDIAAAEDRTALDVIAARMKTFDLGAHRGRLQELGKARFNELAAPVSEAAK